MTGINYLLLMFVFSIALAASFLLTPWVRNIALKRNIVAQPGKRMVHDRRVPFLGGAAIYLAFIISIAFTFYLSRQFRIEFSDKLCGLVIGATIIVLLGLWDDINNIKPMVKLIGQIAVAILLFGYGFRIELLTNPFVGGEIQLPIFLSMLFTITWIVGLINAMNLIDGLDGLAAGITVIVALALICIALYLGNYVTVFLLVILSGSLLGFLWFNFHPAQIFMGDAGSMFLGFILAAVTLMGSQHKSATAVVLLAPITVLTIPIYDTFVAIVRRASKKGSVFKADKRHIHHRLLSTGLTQKQIVLFIYLTTLYLGIFAFLFVLIPEKYALILLVLLALGVLMAMRVIGFIERNARIIHKFEIQKRSRNS